MFLETYNLNIFRKIESGEYLPLTAWGAKGWPMDIIEERCDDWLVHPQLEIKLYRVTTLTIETSAKQVTKEGERAQGTVAGGVAVPKAKAAPKPRTGLPGPLQPLESWEDAQHRAWTEHWNQALNELLNKLHGDAAKLAYSPPVVAEKAKKLIEKIAQVCEKTQQMVDSEEVVKVSAELKTQVNECCIDEKDVAKKLKMLADMIKRLGEA